MANLLGVEVIAACPGAGRSVILNALKKLTEEKVIVKVYNHLNEKRIMQELPLMV